MLSELSSGDQYNKCVQKQLGNRPDNSDWLRGNFGTEQLILPSCEVMYWVPLNAPSRLLEIMAANIAARCARFNARL